MKTPLRQSLLGSLLSALPIVLALVGSARSGGAQSGCGSAHLVPVPQASSATRTTLAAVAAAGPRDFWAVGSRSELVGSQTETFSLVLHGDGQSWIEVPAPSPAVAPGFRSCELLAVAAVGPNEVYAAGTKLIAFPNNGHLGPQIFVLRWDGTQWSEIAAPIPFFSYMASSSGSRVLDIEVAGPNDIWFLGWWSGDELTPAQPLALHYDGSNFTRHDTPLPSTRRELVDGRAFGTSDVWAVGRPTFGGSSPSSYLVHWDGGSWTQVPLLLSPFFSYEPYALDGVSGADFWIAGYETPVGGGTTTGFALHWVAGQIVKYPLRGIPKQLVAFAANEVWALGTKIERWDGASWNLVDDLPGTFAAQLEGAAGVASCDLQAVGTQWNSTRSRLFPLGVRVDPTQGARATVLRPCTGSAPFASFLAERAPALGSDLVLAIDDPLGESGIAPGGALSWWMLSPQQPASAPCGIPVPGLGSQGGLGELLLDPLAGLTSFGPFAWTGAGAPAHHRTRVPAHPFLYGRTVFAQGVLFGGNRAVLTTGLALTIGR